MNGSRQRTKKNIKNKKKGRGKRETSEERNREDRARAREKESERKRERETYNTYSDPRRVRGVLETVRIVLQQNLCFARNRKRFQL